MSERHLSEKTAQSSLGKIIDFAAERDAIHVSLAPVTASERLSPGQHVGLIGGTETAGPSKEPIGIVDPFLAGPVFKGDRFWLFLYPNTVTSLRHHWSHPAFPEDAPVTPAVTEALAHIDARAESKKWLEAKATDLDLTYDALMEVAQDWVRHGTYRVQDGSSHWRDSFGDDAEEFWNHYEIVTGERVPAEDRDGNPFSCSC